MNENRGKAQVLNTIIRMRADADDVEKKIKQLKAEKDALSKDPVINKKSIENTSQIIDALYKRLQAFRKSLDNATAGNVPTITKNFQSLLGQIEAFQNTGDIDLSFNIPELTKIIDGFDKIIEDIDNTKQKIEDLKKIEVPDFSAQLTKKEKKAEEDAGKKVTEALETAKSTRVAGGGAQRVAGLTTLRNEFAKNEKLTDEDRNTFDNLRRKAASAYTLGQTAIKGKTVKEGNVKPIETGLSNLNEVEKEYKTLLGDSEEFKQVSTYISQMREEMTSYKDAIKKAITAQETFNSIQQTNKQNLSKRESDREKVQGVAKDLATRIASGEKISAKGAKEAFKSTGLLIDTRDGKNIKSIDRQGDITQYVQNFIKSIQDITTQIEAAKQKLGNEEDFDASTLYGQKNTAIESAKEPYQQIQQSMNKTKEELPLDVDNLKASTEEINEQKASIEKLGQGFEKARNLLTRYVGAYALLRQASKTVQQAWSDIQELDKQFNEISIVTGKSMEDMWNSFGNLNKIAQQYGVTTSNVVSVQNLYYHQGKSVAEVNQLTSETLTLAKISGLDYADATDKMTAALNAYGIAAEDANTITDVTAALASNAATSTEELMNALTKTASISANAGMSLESTEVFLTKMIETTRESSENLGTALKTITARFTEMKTAADIDEDGTIADFNKVETALKKAGVSLKNDAGTFRDVDDVFMDLSKVWDTLDRNTQRYIATQAAGSRRDCCPLLLAA
jgi:TP901 family phage tail tape measure protein